MKEIREFFGKHKIIIRDVAAYEHDAADQSAPYGRRFSNAITASLLKTPAAPNTLSSSTIYLMSLLEVVNFLGMELDSWDKHLNMKDYVTSILGK